jgi:phosphinothricin acetyltransferase
MIRLARVDDAETIAAVYAPYVESTVITFEVAPPTPAGMRARIEAVLARFPWLVYEVDGSVAGYAYASPHRTREAYQWCADAAIYIDRRYHRRGAGRQLYAALFDTLRRQRIVNVYAGITLPNAGSVGLHESMGFLPIGVYRNVGFKLGAWHDVGWWHLQLQPLPESPLPPVPFPDLA